jgi:hypothetical protein
MQIAPSKTKKDRFRFMKTAPEPALCRQRGKVIQAAGEPPSVASPTFLINERRRSGRAIPGA